MIEFKEVKPPKAKKCPICKQETEHRGICYECDKKYDLYHEYIKYGYNPEELTNNLKECKETYYNIIEYQDNLEIKRKYYAGKTITTVEELVEKDIVMVHHKPTSIGWIQSMQLYTVYRFLKSGSIKEAILKPMYDKQELPF